MGICSGKPATKTTAEKSPAEPPPDPNAQVETLENGYQVSGWN